MSDSLGPVKNENAAEQYFLSREIPPLKATLRLYRNAIAHMPDNWPGTDLAKLHYEVANIVPEAMLFRIWKRLFTLPSPTENQVEGTQTYLRSVENALSRVLESRNVPTDLDDIGALGSEPHKLARRYVELISRQG